MSVLQESLGLGRSDAGVMVNVTQAMRLTAVQGCILIISQDLSSLGHEIFQQLPENQMRLATDHRLWPIIHDEPNETMTAKTFWGALLAAELAWGNGYAWIKRDGARRVTGLYLLDSGKTSPVKLKGELLYATTQTDTGAVAYVKPEDMIHTMGLSTDGIVGISPIQACKNAVGLGLAAEKYGAQFFGNGARMTGILSHPETLDTEARENLKKSLREMATGENALRPMLLEEGMKWENISIKPEEAQFGDLRRFQVVEFARLVRVPMHLLQDLQRSTNNNIEHQALDYVRYCLKPRAVGIEQEVKRKLLTGPFSMEHNFNDMQRGDFASQTAGIQTLRNIGYLSNNDIARRLRENPMSAEEGGDLRMVQGAMIPITAMLPGGANDGTKPVDPTAGEGSLGAFDKLAPAFRYTFRDAVGRTLRRGNDGPAAIQAFEPAIQSMALAMVASRWGYCALTASESTLVISEARRIAAESGSWKGGNSAAIADRISGQVYENLAKEILQ